MKNKWIALVFYTFLSINATVYSQTSAEKAVAESVETFRKLMIDPDKAKLNDIVSDDLSYGHSGGKVEDKAAFVEAFVSGKSDFLKIDLSEQTIKITGKTAIVRHKLIAETHDAGKELATVKLSILTVWIKDHGKWKLLARQAVK